CSAWSCSISRRCRSRSSPWCSEPPSWSRRRSRCSSCARASASGTSARSPGSSPWCIRSSAASAPTPARWCSTTAAATTPLSSRCSWLRWPAWSWRSCCARPSAWLLLLHPHDPVLEPGEQLGQELARGLVGELAVGELRGRVADEDFGPRQGIGPELDQDPAQVVLDPRAAERPRRAREQRHRLVLEHLVRRARAPVDRVLERPRDREVVLRAREENAVRGRDLAAQALHRLGHAGVEHVLVEHREV